MGILSVSLLDVWRQEQKHAIQPCRFGCRAATFGNANMSADSQSISVSVFAKEIYRLTVGLRWVRQGLFRLNLLVLEWGLPQVSRRAVEGLHQGLLRPNILALVWGVP